MLLSRRYPQRGIYVSLRYNDMAILQVMGVHLIRFNLPARARMFIANFGIGVLISCRPAYGSPPIQLKHSYGNDAVCKTEWRKPLGLPSTLQQCCYRQIDHTSIAFGEYALRSCEGRTEVVLQRLAIARVRTQVTKICMQCTRCKQSKL